MIRYKAFSKTGLMPASMGKSLDALPNYGRWSEAVCAQDSVTYVFDGPEYSKKLVERLEKMKAQAT